MICIEEYSDRKKDEWDNFVKESKNYLFMFCRDYMDYHKDRFQDNSLMFYENESLVAVLPANLRDNTLQSHGGLTYGGFITGFTMKQHKMNECFDLLIQYCSERRITTLLYKTIPHIYHNQAAEEDRYSLYEHGAKLQTIDASTYLNLLNPLKMTKGRKAQISRAKREGVTVSILSEKSDYEDFIELENIVLKERHNTVATHSGVELKKLHDYFPNNIHLYAAKQNGSMIAGSVVYEYDSVVHTQYMAADEEARVNGALDLVVSTIIDDYCEEKKWLDFGISTEHGHIYLNEGLISQKEGFGGRTGVYEIWSLTIN